LHTPEDEPQSEQKGGTKQTTIGPPELRVKMVPILGEAFGGNYAFLVWDEEDTQRRAIVVDPADPLPVLQSAEADGLQIVAVLTTHWHFDHSSGNSTLARKLRELRVVASALEVGRTPSVTHRMKDLEELTIGRLVVRGHSVPGHTRGSMVYEIFNAEQKADAPSIAFTGDTLFCGGCGALFECSATTLFHSLRRLTNERLRPSTQLFPGHEYTEMLLQAAVHRDPQNKEAKAALATARLKRARKEPSLPTTVAQEKLYNAQLTASAEGLALMCGCEL